jgi:hypothetical protein
MSYKTKTHMSAYQDIYAHKYMMIAQARLLQRLWSRLCS